jgi:nitrogen-specific signal transduction histidine kinase
MKNLDGDEDKFDKLILVDTQAIPKIVEDEDDKITQTLLFLILNTVQIAGEKIKEGWSLCFMNWKI